MDHKQTGLLSECQDENLEQDIFDLANYIKKSFTAIYLSNYCVNGCVYCSYCFKNTHMPCKKLSQDEIKQEFISSQNIVLRFYFLGLIFYKKQI